MRLLLKDHKPWDPSQVIPSRPVVNGSAGFNCHLSEVLSLILGPVAKESLGSEINSTNDLLSTIEKVNTQITNLSKERSSSNLSKQSLRQTTKPKSADKSLPVDDSNWWDHCSKCNTRQPSEQEIAAANRVVNRTVNKRAKSAMNVSNSLRQKLKASREATKLYHRCWIKPRNDVVD